MADKQPVKIRRALLSVSDKAGLVDFARFLEANGVELVSTGGTARALADAGLQPREVSDLTGFPEMMDGRVKTLHPRVHGGLLALRNKPEHQKAMASHGIGPIDLLVVNLYPFEATVAKGAGAEECVENIDIGGPAMIRSAAKNHAFVAAVVDPSDYKLVMAEMSEEDGATTIALRRRLAAKAFARTAAYDAAIAQWFGRETGEAFPPRLAILADRRQVLRYGENPHQQAAYYLAGERRPGIATAEQLQGKELSYNNLSDADAAYELVAEFDRATPAVAIIKHANPCGVAVGTDLIDAYRKAFLCDPVSPFGGIIALNQTLDGATAEEIGKILTEVIIAPDADQDARKILARKKNLRLLLAHGLPDPLAPGMTLKSIGGGYLLQSRDNGRPTEFKVVTKRAPSAAELDDLKFAFTVCKHVKSNAIVYARNGATVGIGAGQMSRVDSARIAARKAIDAAQAAGLPDPLTKGSVAASDAFFPFADGLLATAEAGSTAVVQPGGSLRDDEVIAACDRLGVAMVVTGYRHFRH